KIDDVLNRNLLCKDCKEKKIEKLNNKCGNKEIARFLYESKLNKCNDYIRLNVYNDYIRWIPFGEFRNIEYLAKGGFGEVHKAIWCGHRYGTEVVALKRLYNSNN